jgi:hypothetical protein
MARRLLSDRDQLEALFDELTEELARLGIATEVVMVGGSWMLWHGRRASTWDVDSARRLGANVTEAVRRVADRHDLGRGWLNDAAAAFWPSGAGYDDCTIVYESATLVVRTPAPEVVFVMKLYRADPQDREDLVSLWPLCDFGGPAEAAEAFRRAYPHAPDDDHLAEYIAEVARDAGQSR